MSEDFYFHLPHVDRQASALESGEGNGGKKEEEDSVFCGKTLSETKER